MWRYEGVLFSPFALIHSAHRQQQLRLLLSPSIEYHLILDESITTQYAMFHKMKPPICFSYIYKIAVYEVILV